MIIRIITTLFILSLTPNVFASQFASIAIDAESGKIKHAMNSDKAHSPASLTKMMTIYLLFEALEKGKYSLSSLLSVSKHASIQPPTKIHVKPGDKITVQHAIEALATKSANDVAVVIAEALAENEGAFAQKMTQKAKSLGMTNTKFYNASGLPHPYQKTTARDIATLGLALMHHFPKYYTFFATKFFNYKGRSYPNHNKLLFSYKGCTGLKTGYTRASGFNLAASAFRDNKNVIAVVLGEKSPGARNLKMTRILNACFNENNNNQSAPAKFMLASQKLDEPINQDKSSSCVQMNLNKKPQTLLKPQNLMKDIKKLTPLTMQKTPLSNNITLQVGAYKTPQAARRAGEKAIKANKGILFAKNVFISPYTVNGKKLYRAQIKNVPQSKSGKICKGIKNQKLPCIEVAI
ncbi:MAG: D-alanyl-D-alanine carboxypeptidase family protein [Alphaproteobacteria bacterium]|nr:D-alanyl-D-alanine carboxypeptidase family protein [Alphaproteobacteria bacterium]